MPHASSLVPLARTALAVAAISLAVAGCGGRGPDAENELDAGTRSDAGPNGADGGGTDGGGTPDGGSTDGGSSGPVVLQAAWAGSPCVNAGDSARISVQVSGAGGVSPSVSAFGRSAGCTPTSSSASTYACALGTQLTDPPGDFALKVNAADAGVVLDGGTLGERISDLRTHWHEGATVTVCDSVVTAVRSPALLSSDQTVYITDPAGGPNAGIDLFHPHQSTSPIPALHDHVRVTGAASTFRGRREITWPPFPQDLSITVLDAGTNALPPPLAHPVQDLTKSESNTRADEALGSLVQVGAGVPTTIVNSQPPELAYFGADGGIAGYHGFELNGGLLVDTFFTSTCMPPSGWPQGASVYNLRGIYDWSGQPDGGGSHVVMPVRCPDIGYPSPIHYVAVIVKENHSFENYFTGFPGADTVTVAQVADGGVITRPVLADGPLPRDLGHSHHDAVVAWADGGMNGFDNEFEGTPTSGAPDYLPYGYFPESAVPAYWAYARAFVLGDNFRSTLLGPTMPGHFATVTGQTPFINNSFCPSNQTCPGAGNGCNGPAGIVVNTFDQNLSTCAVGTAPPCFDVPSVVDQLPDGYTWGGYSFNSDADSYSPFNLVKSIALDAGVRSSHLHNQDTLLADLDAGVQPHVLYANITAPGELSEHPPYDLCPGENYTVELVNALMKSPHWAETAIIITWDDYGGFYDHIPPPVERCANGQVFNPGFRLPIIILSPYARQGFVLHTATEQASIPRLVEELLGMPFMSARDPKARDGRAGSLLGAFDFTQAPRPPLMLQPRTCP